MMETYTVSEVAEILKASKRKILSFIMSGEIKAFRLGNTYRITKDSLQSFIDKNIIKTD